MSATPLFKKEKLVTFFTRNKKAFFLTLVLTTVVLTALIFLLPEIEKRRQNEIVFRQGKIAVTRAELENVTGNISRIESNLVFIIVGEEKKEVRLVTNEETKFLRLQLPFDSKNPPEEAVFTPVLKEIQLSDLRVGQRVFIEGKKDAAGFNFQSVGRLQVLP